MRITIELTTEESVALRRFANLHHPLPVEEAAALALREYLISTGDLVPMMALEEDGEVAGSA
ncbi:MAG: hypothetical protein ACTHOP_08050 [Mesorhizobium sp.]